jgi:FixJ family two-component response regulator
MNSASALELVSGLDVSHAVPTVFIVDDDVSVRESLDLLIRCAGWRPETFATANEFLSRPRVWTPSCLVLDICMPELSGLELQKLIAADLPYMPVIFITSYGDVSMAVQAMRAGAIEFLTKPFGEAALLDAIGHAIGRSYFELGRDAEMRALQDSYSLLSRRERQVMALVVSGRLNKHIGFELDISEVTVKAHRGNVMRKMKAQSLADLVVKAARLNQR